MAREYLILSKLYLKWYMQNKKTSYQYTFMDSGNPSAIYTRGCLCNTKGDILHRISRRVGLREVKSVGREITLNGKPIRLRGVCASEVHPYLGSAYTMEEWQSSSFK